MNRETWFHGPPEGHRICTALMVWLFGVETNQFLQKQKNQQKTTHCGTPITKFTSMHSLFSQRDYWFLKSFPFTTPHLHYCNRSTMFLKIFAQLKHFVCQLFKKLSTKVFPSGCEHAREHFDKRNNNGNSVVVVDSPKEQLSLECQAVFLHQSSKHLSLKKEQQLNKLSTIDAFASTSSQLGGELNHVPNNGRSSSMRQIQEEVPLETQEVFPCQGLDKFSSTKDASSPPSSSHQLEHDLELIHEPRNNQSSSLQTIKENDVLLHNSVCGNQTISNICVHYAAFWKHAMALVLLGFHANLSMISVLMCIITIGVLFTNTMNKSAMAYSWTLQRVGSYSLFPQWKRMLSSMLNRWPLFETEEAWSIKRKEKLWPFYCCTTWSCCAVNWRTRSEFARQEMTLSGLWWQILQCPTSGTLGSQIKKICTKYKKYVKKSSLHWLSTWYCTALLIVINMWQALSKYKGSFKRTSHF